jgi:hypothetical protein
MVACSATAVIAGVEAGIAATEVALPVVAGAAGLSGPVEAQLLDYLQAADTGLGQVAAILAKGGSAGSIAAQITAALTGVVDKDAVIQAQLAATLPPVVLDAVEAVAAAVEGLLRTYGTQAAKEASLGAIRGEKEKRVQFTGRRLARIEKARADAAGLGVRIKKARAKAEGVK